MSPGKDASLASSKARDLALGRLAEARDARRRLKKAYDPDALHDLRVSLRRLRVTLKAYRPYLGRAASGGLRRRVGRLIRPTGRLRDLDVAVAMLRRLGAAKKSSVSRKIEKERLILIESLQSRILPKLKTTARKLKKRLNLPPAAKRRAATWVNAWQIAVLAARDRLTRRGREAGEGGLKTAHRLRIAAKALRYLLEPVEKDLPQAAKEILKARHLQDRLGRERDRVMLRELGVPARSDG